MADVKCRREGCGHPRSMTRAAKDGLMETDFPSSSSGYNIDADAAVGKSACSHPGCECREYLSSGA
jgi:hypothetical protein